MARRWGSASAVQRAESDMPSIFLGGYIPVKECTTLQKASGAPSHRGATPPCRPCLISASSETLPFRWEWFKVDVYETVSFAVHQAGVPKRLFVIARATSLEWFPDV